MKPSPQAEPHHDHLVQFYPDDASLMKTLGRFVREGLSAAQPVVVIGTPQHRAELSARLLEDGLAVDVLERQGLLRMLDARETLETFMIDGTPDAERFNAVIGGLLEVARGPERAAVRAFGEMVDLLWKDGHPEAAIRLEMLWNGLAASHQFTLLCGYSIGSFYKQTGDLDIGDVCGQHAKVMPA